MNELLNSTASRFLEASFQASLLVVGLFVIRSLIGRHLPPAWLYGLGLLVLLRLLVPFSIEAPVAVPSLSIREHGESSQTAIPTREPVSERRSTVLPAKPSGDSRANDRPASAEGAYESSSPRAAAWEESPVLAQETAIPSHRFSLLGFLPAAWLAGVFFILGSTALRHLQLHRFVRRNGRPADHDLVTRLERAGGRRLRLVEVSGLHTAALMGLIRPVILLPAHVRDALTGEEIEDILTHEVAHWRKGDLAINGLVILARAFHWFNPLAWIALRQLIRDREVLRDADAIRFPHRDRLHYGRTLLKAMRVFRPQPLSPTASPIFSTPPEIKRRITMITSQPHHHRLAGAFTFALAIALVLITFTVAAEEDDPEKPNRRPDAERSERARPEPETRTRDAEERSREDRERSHRDRERPERNERERERDEERRDRDHHERREAEEREREDRSHAFERHLDELREALAEARRDRNEELVEEILDKIREVEMDREHRMRDHHHDRERHEAGERFERRIGELKEELDEAKREKDEERAEHLMHAIRQAEAEREHWLHAHRREIERREKAESFERHIGEIRRELEEATREGQTGRALDLLHALREIETERARWHREQAQAEQNAQLQRQLEEMRRHMEEMGHTMHEMRRELHQLRESAQHRSPHPPAAGRPTSPRRPEPRRPEVKRAPEPEKRPAPSRTDN